jgi:hypothetical protein
VFERDGQAQWTQQTLFAENPGPMAWFGHSVALSGDGDILAVGAIHGGGNGTVHVFVRDGQAQWTQQAYLAAPDGAEGFANVALSDDGTVLAVGAEDEDSNATGINGNPADNSFDSAGAVYVFVWDGQAQWVLEAYGKASNPGEIDRFGCSVALSGEGNTLAVGALWEDGLAPRAGAIYLY